MSPQHEPEASSDDDHLRGVGGWLLFFCVSITILTPLASLASTVIGFIQSVPYFSQNLGLMALVLADTALSLAIIGACVYAGVSLWRVRPKAVHMVRIVLIVLAIYALLAPLEPLLLGLTADARQQIIDIWMQTAWRNAMYAVIWLNYLMRSKRVRATYADWNPPVSSASLGPDAKWYHFVIALGLLAAIIGAAFWFTSR